MSRVSGPREQDTRQRNPTLLSATNSSSDVGGDLPVVRPSRVVIESVTPSVDDGRFPAKRAAGDVVDVEADLFTEGHDEVAAAIRWRHESESDWREAEMVFVENDRFHGQFVVDRLGSYEFTVAGWIDEFGTWLDSVRARMTAKQDVKLDLLEGVQMLERSVERATGSDRPAVERLMAQISAGSLATIDDAELRALMRRLDGRSSLCELTEPRRVTVERSRARFSSWYELFPRSTSTDRSRPGTLADVIDRLPYVASMGFDVVYLPPVHPIGRSHRKGKNNSVTAGHDDVGSPWAIGGVEGGHEAVHPALGTTADVRRLVDAAHEYGIEVALDLALQCSPDHPWVRDHPTWFRHRPDGTIRTAENPPKRYEDIFPLDFSSEDWQDLWLAVADLLETWIARGIKIFRVDNPHTKPFAFWEWLLATTRRGHPDVIFLSEAFTRPKVMHRLAKVGFSQSYTYFTWRQSASELREYFTELRTGETPEYFRPNAWPNTPDILTDQLQEGTRGTFIARFVLAATLCANYGIYGPVFELGLHEPRPGSEEYIDSEKYEVTWWDLDQPHSLRHIIAAVNGARRTHTALQTDETLRFHRCDNPQLLCYSKTATSSLCADRIQSDAPILVVVNTDARHRQAGFIDLDLESLGIGARQPFTARDLLGGAVYSWQGGRQYVELDALRQPAHVFELRPHAVEETEDNYAATESL